MSGAGGIYIFKGNSLVVPSGTKAELSTEAFTETFMETPAEKVKEAFGGADGADFFEIPAIGLDSKGGPDTEPIRAVTLAAGFHLGPAWETVPVREALDLMTGSSMADGAGPTGRLLRSYHISLWRGESRFCGSCGSPNGDAGNGELARKCEACGRLEFPRISPAIITIIVNEKDEALLAHNKKFSPGLYSLIAGFNEAGESLEATVAREIREEVGIEVKDIRYVRSQPWPFPNSLMLGFTAVYASGGIKPDGIEIEDARWFKKNDLPLLPGNGSVSRYLIGLWLEGKI